MHIIRALDEAAAFKGGIRVVISAISIWAHMGSTHTQLGGLPLPELLVEERHPELLTPESTPNCSRHLRLWGMSNAYTQHCFYI